LGFSGSKSSLAQQPLAEDPRRQLISTDAIRSQLFGDEAIQDRGCWFGGKARRPISASRCANRAQRHGKRFTMLHECPTTTPARSHCTCPAAATPTLLGASS